MQDESGSKLWKSRRDVDGLQAPEAEPHRRGRVHDRESLADLSDDRYELCGGKLANVRAPITRPRERQRTMAQFDLEAGTQWCSRRRVAAGKTQDNLSHARGERNLDGTHGCVHDARLHAPILPTPLRSRRQPSSMAVPLMDRPPGRSSAQGCRA